MHILDYTDKNITETEFVALINNARKANKNKWYAFVGKVHDKNVIVKGIDTWLQQFIVDSLNQPTAMDIPVKQFLAELSRPFKN